MMGLKGDGKSLMEFRGDFVSSKKSKEHTKWTSRIVTW